MAAIADQVRHFVVENFLFGDDSDLRDNEQSFLESGIVDSTGVLELVAFLESDYDIKIADDELVPQNLDSIAKIAAFVETKKK